MSPFSEISRCPLRRFSACVDRDIPVTWFSMGGWFYGITRGHSLSNVLVRIEQFRHAAEPVSCLRLARQFVRGKIHNHRVLFMRNHVEPPERTKLRLGQAREDALTADSLDGVAWNGRSRSLGIFPAIRRDDPRTGRRRFSGRNRSGGNPNRLQRGSASISRGATGDRRLIP